nr:cold-regulated 47 [Tanacetum cinerariifolium]
RRWLLTHAIKLAITKCLHSSEYLFALGAAIGKAIEKGMQDGLATGITHGVEGRVLADVAAYNPFAKADYFSALQRLQNINFSLLVELRSNKDASIDTIMNILRLGDNLAERLGLTESQPCVDQLMVPIHHSSDRVVVGSTSLGTSDTMAAPITTALFVISMSASTIPPISTDDYEIAHTKDEEDVVADVEAVADEGADPFPDVADIPCSRKSVSIAVSKPVRSFAQCFCDFVWSLLLRSDLALVFRMACFVVPVDKVSWTKAYVSDPGIGFVILAISTPVVLKVGMPISAGITASTPYVNENGVSSLLDLIMASVGPFYQAIGLGMLNGGKALADA